MVQGLGASSSYVFALNTSKLPGFAEIYFRDVELVSSPISDSQSDSLCRSNWGVQLRVALFVWREDFNRYTFSF
jgi:hypothetical protein